MSKYEVIYFTVKTATPRKHTRKGFDSIEAAEQWAAENISPDSENGGYTLPNVPDRYSYRTNRWGIEFYCYDRKLVESSVFYADVNRYAVIVRDQLPE